MRLVERKDLNETLWAEWCRKSPEAGPFCQLEYLDAVSENVLFLIDNDNGGIALPYKIRFGVKTIYTPVFCRWISIVGERKLTSDYFSETLKNTFKQADVYAQFEFFSGVKEPLIFQTVNQEQFTLNTQAKRKIKKASNELWSLAWDKPVEMAIDLIESSLINKFETLEDSSFPKLRKLAANFNASKQLKVISLVNEKDEILGSLLLISTGSQLLYLKGACEESTKQMGGMYYLMNAAIQQAMENGQSFDFGGSRIPGVRKFNLSFGAVDQTYFHYNWDKGPLWYAFMKKLRNIVKK